MALIQGMKNGIISLCRAHKRSVLSASFRMEEAQGRDERLLQERMVESFFGYGQMGEKADRK